MAEWFDGSGPKSIMRTPDVKIKTKPGKFSKKFIDKMNSAGAKKPDVDYNEDFFEFVKDYDPGQAKEFKAKYSSEMRALDGCA